MKTRFTIRAVVIIIPLIIVASIGFLYIQNHERSSESTTPKTISDMQNRWLNGTRCRMPCWEGLTPGKTTLIQAIDNLINFGYVNSFTVDESTSTGEVEWHWTFATKGEGGRIFYDKESKKIFAVVPHIICCLSLGEVIEKFGNPSHVIVFVSRYFEDQMAGEPFYSYNVIWLEKGFEVIGGPAKEGSIDKNFIVSSIVLFEPTEEGLRKQEGRIVDLMVPWQGYNNRSVYIHK
jgi:hypothetical protein